MRPDVPRILIATPVFCEDERLIRQNLSSVKRQTGLPFDVCQVFVNDGVSNLALKSCLTNKSPSALDLSARFNHADYGDYCRRLSTRLSFRGGFKAITYLDADNYLKEHHLKSVLETHQEKRKNIVISDRIIVDKNGNTSVDCDRTFFDTNTITLFGECKKIGLLWGRYPREMSLIGDRIISKYIQTNFADQIAYTNRASVIYRHSKISQDNIISFKGWYEETYSSISSKFRKLFGFDLVI